MMLPAAIFFLIFPAGCSCRLNLPAASGQVKTRARMTLNGQPFELRFSQPARPSANNVLIVYATGDGGWLGLGSDVFDWMAGWNYPVAGFSARSYIHNLGHNSDAATTTPELLVKDYEEIIDCAENQLGLAPSTKVILVGVSRGAGFAVVAAGAGGLEQRLAGLLAIALTREEEHVLHRPRGTRSAGEAADRPRVMIQTYSYLDRVSPFPLMVLQSTHDGYLPADQARELFGPDTELRKLRPVPATNHSFRHGCQTLYRDTEEALQWIIGVPSRPQRQ
jgi:fermentation-respiration switch protein FrsA (DUF1100 family)